MQGVLEDGSPPSHGGRWRSGEAGAEPMPAMPGRWSVISTWIWSRRWRDYAPPTAGGSSERYNIVATAGDAGGTRTVRCALRGGTSAVRTILPLQAALLTITAQRKLHDAKRDRPGGRISPPETRFTTFSRHSRCGHTSAG